MSVCIHTHICVGGHVRNGRPKIDNRCLPYQSLTYMLPQGLVFKPELTLSAPVASCIAVGIPFPPTTGTGITGRTLCPPILYIGSMNPNFTPLDGIASSLSAQPSPKPSTYI